MRKLLLMMIGILLVGSLVSGGVYINEVEMNPATGKEWVEVVNMGDTDVDISGWKLYDGLASEHLMKIIGSVILGDGEFYVVDVSGLNDDGDFVILKNSDGEIIDTTTTKKDNYGDNRTWQRVPDGTGNFTFKEMTKGVTNEEVVLLPVLSGDNVTQNLSVYVVNESLVEDESYPACAFEGQNLTISAKVFWGECSDGEVWAEVKLGNLGWQNFSATLDGDSIYYIVLNSSLVNESDEIYFQFFAKDCFNFSYNGSVWNFAVRNLTYLGVNPWPVNGLNGWFVTSPIFNLVEDGLGGNVYYQWDSDDVYLYGVPFGLENIPNGEPVTAGTLGLNWWTDFGVCGNETKNSQTFYIDLTDPYVNGLWPAPDDVIYENRPTIYSYIDEVYQSNSGVNLSSVVMKVDGVIVNASVIGVGEIDAEVSYLPTENLSEGRHNVSVYAVDNAGRVGHEFWEFDVGNASLFFMNVYSPVDGNYNSRRVEFNLTTSEEVAKIEYINYNDSRPRWRMLCRDCEEYGFLKKKTKSLGEGENILGLRATSYEGLVVEESVSVFIDSKAPKISKTLPKRNRYTNGSGFYVKYTEENPVRLSVFYNASLNLSFENCSEIGSYKECWFDLNLSEHNGDEIEYRFEIEDVVGNVVSSRPTKVNVDTTAPVVENNDSFWQQGIGRYARYIYFNLNISEDNLGEVSYLYVDSKNVTRERSLCNRLRDGICEKRVSFRKGDFLMSVSIVDEAGNSIAYPINYLIDY
ncbi:MAG: lamin tail domain-containing protein [archaeon]